MILFDLFREEISSDGKATIGRLCVNSTHEWFTLEDIPRAVKIKKETAIPAGSYDLVIDLSARFKRLMPHVLDVPGFQGIRIHAGNTDKDTEGCILLGQAHIRGQNFISHSKLAFDDFYFVLSSIFDKGEKCRITIHDIPKTSQVEGIDI